MRQKTHSSSLPIDPSRLPPGQQLVAAGKWPMIGERVPAQSSRPWSLTLSGCLAEPLSLTIEQLHEMRESKLTVDIHCVTRWSKLGVEFTGVGLADLVAMAKVNSNAKFVSFVSRSDRRHSTSLSLETALAQQTLIAMAVDVEPLPTDHGGPIRNIVPGRYFYKSVKWLEEIEFLTQDRLGFWEAESGYHNQADPWLEQRYLATSLDRREAARLIESRDFTNHDLRGLDASNRNLAWLKASGAALRNADFSHSNLQHADFTDANLSNAHFRKSDLRHAIFRNTDLEGADLSGADLRSADFRGSSLIGCSFYDPASSTKPGTILDETTILPDEVIEPLFPLQMQFLSNIRDKLAE